MSALALEDTWLPLDRSHVPLVANVEVGDVGREAARQFDYEVGDHPSFSPYLVPDLPESFGVGVIVGGSGTGKTTLLRALGDPDLVHHWDDSQTIADQIGDDAVNKFYAVGLSSVPTWLKPYGVLSNGERFRADLARSLHDGAVVDEFTSVVDRNVAMSVSRTLGKYVRGGSVSRLVVATCHRDVLPWLEPDWIIDTDAGLWAIKPRECLQRRPLVADVYEVDRAMWPLFMGHHYLTPNLHPFARCYLAVVSGSPVSFAAAIPFPHGRIRHGWRGTRLVTFPDFQGLGVGPRLADWVAEAHHRAGYAYYAKTTHPRLGEYRDANPVWEATSHSKRKKPTARSAPRSFATRKVNAWVGSMRPSYSHKYVGGGPA